MFDRVEVAEHRTSARLLSANYFLVRQTTVLYIFGKGLAATPQAYADHAAVSAHT